MGDHKNGTATLVFASIGLALLLAMAARTATVTLPGKIKQYRESLQAGGEPANTLAGQPPSRATAE